MKKMIFILGMMFGLLISFTFTSFASDLNSFIGKSVQGVFPIEIGGKQLTGVVIDDTTYAPARALGEAVGLEVSFIDKKVIMREPGNDMEQLKSEISTILTNDGKIAEITDEIIEKIIKIGKINLLDNPKDMVQHYYQRLDRAEQAQAEVDQRRQEKEIELEQKKKEKEAEMEQKRKEIEEGYKEIQERQKELEKERQQSQEMQPAS